MVYCAGSIALALLEARVHLGMSPPRDEYVLFECRIPESASIHCTRAEELAGGWESDFDRTRAFGRDWHQRGDSLALLAPSVIPVHESATICDKNVLIRPRHADFELLNIASARPSRFDERLFEPLP